MRSLGRKPEGERLERIKASPLWTGAQFRNIHPIIPGLRAFLPVHWGTFSLAMHAWDQPAETLLELDPKAGARLVMPRLGQPVEPAYAEDVEPWWRVVDTAMRGPAAATSAAITLPKAMPWPID